MAAKQEEMNGAINNGVEREEMEKGTENQTTLEIVVVDSDGSESHANSGVDGETKTGGAGISSSCSCWISRPIPPFLQKIFHMLGNDETSSIVSWSCTGTSFVIKNPHLFAANVLPTYFKHNNFQSFITQLNAYGFKKISWEQWEYSNEYFRKGEKDLLKNIKRRDNISRRIQPDMKPCLDVSSCSSNIAKELTILMKEHHLVKAEVMKLKMNQQTLEEKLVSLENRAMGNKEEQRRLVLMAQTILKKQKNPSCTGVPKLEESGERDQKNLKGKRKLEEESATTQDNKEKMLLDEEELEKHQSNTFIPLEDLIGEPSDWLGYIKEMQEKASHLKS